MAGNSRAREPSLRRKRALRGGHASISPLRRTRSLHHRQVDLQNGEQARPGTLPGPRGPCSTCSTAELQAFLPGGSRTRDHVVKSEVPDRFTTVRQRGCRGTGETETTTVAQGSAVASAARSPRRDAHCGGRLHGTQLMPVEPRPLLWRSGLVWSEVSVLFTTDNGFQGAFDAVFGAVETKESASSPPGVRKILLCFPFRCWRRGGKQKTPPQRGLGRGSTRSNCGVALSHSSSAGARARAALCEPRGVPFQIVEHASHVGALGCRRTTIVLRRERDIVADRGDVKAVCGGFSGMLNPAVRC